MKTDDRNLFWELERPELIDNHYAQEMSFEARKSNSHVTPYNYAVGACLSCNQAMIFFGKCRAMQEYHFLYDKIHGQR